MTRAAQPPRCDPDIYTHGNPVLVTHSIGAWQIEGWVRKVAKLSKQPVDWFFVGGRALIKTTGDPVKVLGACFLLKDEHDALQKAEHDTLLDDHPFRPSWRPLITEVFDAAEAMRREGGEP